MRTISELRAAYDSGEADPKSVVEDVISNIESQKALNAFLSVRDLEQLTAESTEVDFEKPLAGIPVALKDNICMRGERTTAASKMLENFVAPYDATVTSKLKAAGAIIVGKTNLDEFAMGSSNENSAFGSVQNPAAPGKVPGGSSGGSAAAVAADLVPVALGSDTGGSIRQPASFCGVVGVKPTYGRVSRYGLIAFASSLDQIGPMTKTVDDAALVLEAISGHDPNDMTSANKPALNLQEALQASPNGKVIGVPAEYYDPNNLDGLSPEVAASMEKAIDVLKQDGATLKPISLPHTKYAVATYYLIATAEASSNLARFDGVRYGHRAEDAKSLVELYENSRSEGFGDEVKRRIMLGTYVLSSGFYDAYYQKAQCVRTLIREDFRDAFTDVDAVLTPVVPTPPFALDEKIDDPLTMYLADIFTISCNLAGIPGISVPFASSDEGPIGVQLMTNVFDEATMFTLAKSLERGKS